MPVTQPAAEDVPMLSAAESPLLILEARPQRHASNPFPLRRKSSLPLDERRRGSSVPAASSSASSASSCGSSASSSPSDVAVSLPLRAPPPPPPPPPPPSQPPTLGPPPGSSRRRGLTLSRRFLSSRREDEAADGRSLRRRRRVTFKPGPLPDQVAPCPQLLSYDELLFNVAGLYQTTDFLLAPEDFGDARARDEDGEHGGGRSNGSARDDRDALPPLERSVPLMIAEFLYRSAVYLGYPPGDKPWLPGFRESKRFSTNDVRRWRRLVHYDWEREEREFERRQAAYTTRGRTLARTDSASSMGSTESGGGGGGGGFRVDGPALPSTAVALPSETPARARSRDRLRAAVSKVTALSSRQRRKQQQRQQDAEDDNRVEGEDGDWRKVDMEHPPAVDPRRASSGELELLVSIVNSCVYCGDFRFRARDVVSLCNVDIDKIQ